MDDQTPSAPSSAPHTQDAEDGLTSERSDAEKAHFVMENRARLIQHTSTVMAIVDSLGTMVHHENYQKILAEKTPIEQMRMLYTTTLDIGGAAVIKAAFYDALKEHEPHLLKKPEAVSQQQFKNNLKEKINFLLEWIKKQKGKKTLLNEVFTELYITEEKSEEANDEHEVSQIETASRKADRSETPIKYEDMFEPSPGEDAPRTVMTKGVAGIGKTVTTQKCALDWAEDKANQNVKFMFPFTFRQLNRVKGEKFSLVGLLHHYFGNIKEEDICSLKGSGVMIILDGLDESRLSLNFKNPVKCTDPKKTTTVDLLLTNLISGNLLPSARIWITTRPAAANQIPSEHVDRMTEVRGFSDPQKEEYFRKRFRDENHTATTIISHVQASRCLHIMCYIPVFCWIIAGVLENMLRKRVKEALPKSLTAMFIHFMVVQSEQKNTKYHDSQSPAIKNSQAIRSMGKLAFEQLQKGNLIFYEKDLTDCGIDIPDATVYSGVFTQIFKEEHGLYEDTVFSFVHLSVQEFLAALYVFLKFMDTGVNLLSKSFKLSKLGKSKDMCFYESAVDKALKSPNGHLNLFLRFLLGLSLETNQTLLCRLLPDWRLETRDMSQINQKIIEYIKKMIKKKPSQEKVINLFHCLNELNDHSLETVIQQQLVSGTLNTAKLSSAQWSTLVFILLSSGKELDVFDLKKYSASEEALLRMLPVVKASNRALLSGCNLTERSCERLSSVISSSSSNLTELDLSKNDLRDEGVQRLCVGLRSPNCKLKTLRLSRCMISEKGCSHLISALRSNSHLEVLDLSYNHPGDSVELLSALPLQNLSVDHCGENRLLPLKYYCQLSLDQNTASNELILSEENRKVTWTRQDQRRPKHKARFTRWPQVLSRESLPEHSYFEVEWSDAVNIAVSYKDIKGEEGSSGFGYNNKSWALCCTDSSYRFYHDNILTDLSGCPSTVQGVARGVVGVYSDHRTGSVSFYTIDENTTLLHTVNTTFTKPLYAGIYTLGTAEVCKIW